MKKLLVFLLLLAFYVPSAFAGRTESSTVIEPTLLDNSPTSITGTKTVKNADKVGCFITYDETEVGGGVSATVTAQISWDGVTWVNAQFYDFAGGATLQASEAIAGDGNYYFWFDYNIPFPFIKLSIVGTATDIDDTALVSARLVTREA